MSNLKTLINSILPSPVLSALQRYRMRRRWPGYMDLSTQQLFTKIYEDGVWGQSPTIQHEFFSGTGSHDGIIVDTYINAVRALLNSFDSKPDVVDLGCGDFFVGSHIRPLCGRYTACDIVEPLIQFNREKYAGLDVDFKVLDLSKDELPAGDIVFIRQVLQHLSNAQIKNAIPEISSRYRYLVLTEHLPAMESFVPNVDHPSGPDNRLEVDSGIVLTSAPFNLKVLDRRCLCEVPEVGGVIRTDLYTLARANGQNVL